MVIPSNKAIHEDAYLLCRCGSWGPAHHSSILLGRCVRPALPDFGCDDSKGESKTRLLQLLTTLLCSHKYSFITKKLHMTFSC